LNYKSGCHNTMTTKILPSAAKMKAALVASHGDDIEKLLSISNTHPIPVVRNPRELLVKVHACALAPGDIRVMKGHCDFFQSPGTFPYIPGGDLSGVVVRADASSRFKAGDEIVAMFDLPRPLNGLAEFAVVKESNAEIKPPALSWSEGACVTSSAVTALAAAKKYISEGDRVLILGGSGGVGTALVQLARKYSKASYIVATSTDKALLMSLGADRVVNYREECWWEIADFEDNSFDVIFDLGVGRKQAWTAAKNYSILKRNGKFVTLSGHNPEFKIHNAWQAIGLPAVMFGRTMGSACWPYIPKYVWYINGLEVVEGETLKELLRLVADGKLRIVFDPISPLPFSVDGIQRGFELMNARRAHGKVVVNVAEES
jgi:alcohol dehydrogenase